MYLIDSNIFIEVLCARDNAQECRVLFEKIDSGRIDCICTHFSVHSVCILLEREGMIGKMHQFLEYLLSLDHLVVIGTSLEDELAILSVMNETGLDFDDSMQYFVSRKVGCDKIITFDSDYKKAGIETARPADVL